MKPILKSKTKRAAAKTAPAPRKAGAKVGNASAAAKKPANKRPAAKARGVPKKGLVYQALRKKARKALTFGSVTLEGVVITSHRAHNIESGRIAMREVADLATPGVTLRLRHDTPRYVADKNDPNAVVRVLHGKHVKGRFVNGRFQPT